MKLKDILKDIPVIKQTADPELEIPDIAYDSRKVVPGGLFVAVTGYVTDGNRYMGKAFENGAVCALAEYLPEDVLP